MTRRTPARDVPQHDLDHSGAARSRVALGDRIQIEQFEIQNDSEYSGSAVREVGRYASPSTIQLLIESLDEESNCHVEGVPLALRWITGHRFSTAREWADWWEKERAAGNAER